MIYYTIYTYNIKNFYLLTALSDSAADSACSLHAPHITHTADNTHTYCNTTYIHLFIYVYCFYNLLCLVYCLLFIYILLFIQLNSRGKLYLEKALVSPFLGVRKFEWFIFLNFYSHSLFSLFTPTMVYYDSI